MMNVPGSWWPFALIFWACAALLIGFGYLIRVHKKLNLLAGYRREAVADEDGLARDAGTVVYLIGVVTSIVPIAALRFPDDGSIVLIAVGYCAVVILLVLVLAGRSRRHMR